MSTPQLRVVAEKGLRAIARMHNIHEEAHERFGEMIAALEINAAAFAMGFARGYYSKPGQDVTIFGVPIDLGAGFALHAMGLGLVGKLGRYGTDAHNLGNGCFASYSTTLGLRIGIEQQGKGSPLSLAPPAAAHGWSDADLSRMVASVAR